MSNRLPPLTALRAFEAAARHMSFAKAAEEIGVTPAALSFQIKSLEDHLGQPVFRRLNRAVALTEAGHALAPGTSEGFEALNAAWRAAKRVGHTRILSVTAGPAFTTKWLAPRMYHFAQAHPAIELRFTASLRMMDFDRDGIDVAVRYGFGPDRGLHSEKLMDEVFVPLMAPALAARFPTPDSLRSATLFADDSVTFMPQPPDWQAWFRANGLQSPTPSARFTQADHALDAALAGTGVVLGRSSLALEPLSRGTLVAPYDIVLTSDARFRFVCRRGAEAQPSVAAFRSWLLSEIDRFPDRLSAKHRVALTDL